MNSPIIGIDGSNIYILDSANSESELIEVQANEVAIGSLHRIINNLIHTEAVQDSYLYVSPSEITTVMYLADEGYQLPDSVIVSNAEYEWDQASGTLTLKNPSNTVNVTIVSTLLP